jgi:uncharacterized protein YeaO (DUF488 family)
MNGQIRIEKSIYDPREADDGKRILVMRLWPRGIRKSHVDLWLKEAGSSRELIRDWKAGKITWARFRQRYSTDMRSDEGERSLAQIVGYARKGKVTLLCSCRDPEQCHRSILKQLVERMMT